MLRLPPNALQVSRPRHPCLDWDGLRLFKTDALNRRPRADERRSMLVRSEDGLATVEANYRIQPPATAPPTSPFLRLPAELIVKIFECAIEHDSNSSSLLSECGPTLLILTPICQELRNIGITVPPSMEYR